MTHRQTDRPQQVWPSRGVRDSHTQGWCCLQSCLMAQSGFSCSRNHTHTQAERKSKEGGRVKQSSQRSPPSDFHFELVSHPPAARGPGKQYVREPHCFPEEKGLWVTPAAWGRWLQAFPGPWAWPAWLWRSCLCPWAHGSLWHPKQTVVRGTLGDRCRRAGCGWQCDRRALPSQELQRPGVGCICRESLGPKGPRGWPEGVVWGCHPCTWPLTFPGRLRTKTLK